MQVLGIMWMAFCIAVSDQKMEVNFGKGGDGAKWSVVNDGVMGGLSQGQAVLTPGSILFEGRISLDNNGGFASLRSPYQKLGLMAYHQVSIRYRSTGQDFYFVIENHAQFYLPNYKVPLGISSEWKVAQFDLASFEEYRMGRSTGGMITPQALEQAIRIGFINGGKKAGPFELEVDYIKFE